MTAFHFDPDFMETVMSSEGKLRIAREQFKRHGLQDLNSLYRAARRTIGLA